VDCDTCNPTGAAVSQSYRVNNEQLAALTETYPTAARILQQFGKRTEGGELIIYPIGFFTGSHERLNEEGKVVNLVHYYGAINSPGLDDLVFDLAFEEGVEHPGFSPSVPPPSVRVTFGSAHAYDFTGLSAEIREPLEQQFIAAERHHRTKK
jgi:hypothetical protein